MTISYEKTAAAIAPQEILKYMRVLKFNQPMPRKVLVLLPKRDMWQKSHLLSRVALLNYGMMKLSSERQK
ncbi:hypothetical protein QUA32_19980 [Microcoleus sp. Pol14D6]|uniref:hypothetical protein n=1 Tax=unclassified Microcoleus TaxID=2642155 RepID=UPI002FD54915